MNGTSFDYDSSARPPRAIEEILAVAGSTSLLRALVGRNIKVRYKRSLLGVAWTAANPLLMLLVLTLAFSTIFREVAPSYPVFLFPGLLMWNLFAQITMVIAVETSGAAALWKRAPIPKTVMPISTAVTGVVNLGLVLVPFSIILAMVRPPVGFSWLSLIPVALLATTFALGVGLVLSSIALYFPDVVQLFEVFLSALFFMTPVIYPLDSTPASVQGFMRLNPMAHFVEAFRAPLYQNHSPSFSEFGILTLFAILSLAIGWFLFTRSADDIPYQS